MPAQDVLADKWLKMFPQKAYNLVMGHKLPPGARLVSVTSEVTNPTSKEPGVKKVRQVI